MILSCLKSGIRRMWENKRMVITFYAVNLLVGLLVMLPFRNVLGSFVGHSLTGEKLAGRFDMDFLFDFLTNNKGAVDVITGLIFVAAALYGLAGLFLSGGAFTVIAGEGGYSASVFWGSAARHFGRFFRLFLWSLPVFAIFYCVQFIETGIVRLVFGGDPYQNVSYWGGWVKLGLAYIGLLFYTMAFDYARIYLVLHDERRTRIAMWQGIKFSFTHPFKTFGLALTLFITGAIVLIIYNPIADLLTAPHALVVLLLFIVQQLYIVFRMGLKLTLYASQVDLYNRLTPLHSVSEAPPDTAAAAQVVLP